MRSAPAGLEEDPDSLAGLGLGLGLEHTPVVKLPNEQDESWFGVDSAWLGLIDPLASVQWDATL